MNVAELVLRHAALEGREALVDYESGRRRTFRELDTRVRRLATALRLEHGVARGDRIAVLSRNAIEYMEILLAGALDGFLVQALNWRLSAGELTEILLAQPPRVVFFHEDLADVVAAMASEVEDVTWVGWSADGGPSELEALIDRAGTAPISPAQAGGDDPMLVVYTGGTTGVSKGAVHTHATAVAAMAQNAVAERIVPTDRFLLMGQMFHSPVLLAINYLTHGCPVVMVNFKPEVTLSAIEEERVTASMGIPTMFQMMIPHLTTGRWDMGSLRNVQYGGSPIGQSVVRELIDLLGCGLIQCYGRTEELAITFLSQEDHLRAVAGEHVERLESCGREAWLTSILLADHDGSVVPADSGAQGELVARSPSAMVGYLGRPDLTAEATYAPGWLRTGDVAQRDRDGYLYLVGRAKELIISGGENIYPAQVERAIQKHRGVEEVAVVGVPDAHWGESVKAFVVARPGFDVAESDVVDAVAVHLGSYQKPREVEFLSEMPKTSTGKIDKLQLKDRSPEQDPRT